VKSKASLSWEDSLMELKVADGGAKNRILRELKLGIKIDQ